MMRARQYAAVEAKNAEKNQKHMISWVTFRRWENYWRDAKKEVRNNANVGNHCHRSNSLMAQRMKKNPHLYPTEEDGVIVQPQLVWEPKGPVGNFYNLHEQPKVKLLLSLANLQYNERQYVCMNSKLAYNHSFL